MEMKSLFPRVTCAKEGDRLGKATLLRQASTVTSAATRVIRNFERNSVPFVRYPAHKRVELHSQNGCTEIERPEQHKRASLSAQHRVTEIIRPAHRQHHHRNSNW